jgi:hypothetical protein
MPKKARKSLVISHHERVREAVKHRMRLIQDRLHEERRRQRKVLRNELGGRRPPEWQVRQRAILKITAEEQPQAADE